MTDHWCKYCNGVNTHNCQFNPNLPRTKIYTTNTAVVSDNEVLLRQALEALESGAWDPLSGSRVSAAIRGRLGEKE